MSDAIGDIEMRITGLRRQWILEMKNGDMDIKNSTNISSCRSGRFL